MYCRSNRQPSYILKDLSTATCWLRWMNLDHITHIWNDWVILNSLTGPRNSVFTLITKMCALLPDLQIGNCSTLRKNHCNEWQAVFKIGATSCTMPITIKMAHNHIKFCPSDIFSLSNSRAKEPELFQISCAYLCISHNVNCITAVAETF